MRQLTIHLKYILYPLNACETTMPNYTYQVLRQSKGLVLKPFKTFKLNEKSVKVYVAKSTSFASYFTPKTVLFYAICLLCCKFVFPKTNINFFCK